jgi:hypothetical protein
MGRDGGGMVFRPAGTSFSFFLGFSTMAFRLGGWEEVVCAGPPYGASLFPFDVGIWGWWWLGCDRLEGQLLGFSFLSSFLRRGGDRRAVPRPFWSRVGPADHRVRP